MSDYISRDVAIIEFMDNDIDHIQAQNGKEAVQILSDIPAADVVPVVRCKDCKHFELNPVTVVDDIPLILAHEICTFWGNGCKTAQDGFCSYGKRK